MIAARAEIVSNVWKLQAAEGDEVEVGDTLAVLETMKMEIPVYAQVAGRVANVLVTVGQIVQEGDAIMEIDETSAR